jgi:hypothetical protein
VTSCAVASWVDIVEREFVDDLCLDERRRGREIEVDAKEGSVVEVEGWSGVAPLG